MITWVIVKLYLFCFPQSKAKGSSFTYVMVLMNFITDVVIMCKIKRWKIRSCTLCTHHEVLPNFSVCVISWFVKIHNCCKFEVEAIPISGSSHYIFHYIRDFYRKLVSQFRWF